MPWCEQGVLCCRCSWNCIRLLTKASDQTSLFVCCSALCVVRQRAAGRCSSGCCRSFCSQTDLQHSHVLCDGFACFGLQSQHPAPAMVCWCPLREVSHMRLLLQFAYPQNNPARKPPHVVCTAFHASFGRLQQLSADAALAGCRHKQHGWCGWGCCVGGWVHVLFLSAYRCRNGPACIGQATKVVSL